MNKILNPIAKQFTILRAFWNVLAISLLSSIAAGLMALLIRRLTGLSTLGEILGELSIRLIPLPLFTFFLDTFGGEAKHLYLAAITFIIMLITVILGALSWGVHVWFVQRGWLIDGTKLTWIERVVFVILLWGIDACIIVPILGGGFAGSTILSGMGSLIIAHLIYGIIFMLFFIPLLIWQNNRSKEMDDVESSRRTFVRYIALGVGALIVSGGVGFLTWGLTKVQQGTVRLRTGFGSTPPRLVPPPVPSYGNWVPVSGQTPEVTDANDFYVVSKNFSGDPSIDASSWNLEITGLVEHPFKLTYNELLSLSSLTQPHTLECISNNVGENLMGSATWKGVQLRSLLERAGVQLQARFMVFHAADGYSDRLTLDQAMDERTIIAYHMNGDPLTASHGFPARLLVPDLYGMKNGKWLHQLELVADDYAGYWEQRGWTQESYVKPTTRIDTPQEGDVFLSRPLFIAGIAYAGAQGVGQVEVSTDGGLTWQIATLKQPPNELTWVLWEYSWTPLPGSYLVVARCITSEGDYQVTEIAPPLPNGASGYHSVSLTIR
jgi:DMSO/TMAO reductase YedYZ molybdopterin-dependent catalytic subunit